uniref:Putative structural protein n=1 Tax=viral metagenome TaxID=1070528 RepID=A0A6M3J2E2_9ZZZZ
MAFWTAIPVVGKVIDGVLGMIDKSIEDKDEAAALKAKLTEVFNNSDLSKFSEQINAQMQIIVAEATGKSWLQRNWRPGLMSLFGVIIFNNYVLNPWISAMFSINVIMEIPPDMWALLKLGIGGYVVGRSAEKGLEIWKSKKDSE